MHLCVRVGAAIADHDPESAAWRTADSTTPLVWTPASTNVSKSPQEKLRPRGSAPPAHPGTSLIGVTSSCSAGESGPTTPSLDRVLSCGAAVARPVRAFQHSSTRTVRRES